MKRFTKELIVLAVQLLTFYAFPPLALPFSPIGMVILMLWATILLSAILGAISGEAIKFAYPLATAVLFLPSIFLYYNESAAVHSVWYLVVSAIGLLIGVALRKIFHRR